MSAAAVVAAQLAHVAETADVVQAVHPAVGAESADAAHFVCPAGAAQAGDCAAIASAADCFQVAPAAVADAFAATSCCAVAIAVVQIVDLVEVADVVHVAEPARAGDLAAIVDVADFVPVVPPAVDMFAAADSHGALALAALAAVFVQLADVAEAADVVHVVQSAGAADAAGFHAIVHVDGSVQAPPVAVVDVSVARRPAAVVVVDLADVVDAADFGHCVQRVRVAHAVDPAAIVDVAVFADALAVAALGDGKNARVLLVAQVVGPAHDVGLDLLAPAAGLVRLVGAVGVVETHYAIDRVGLAFSLAVLPCRVSLLLCAQDSISVHVHFDHGAPYSQSHGKHVRNAVLGIQHYLRDGPHALFRFAAKECAAALDSEPRSREHDCYRSG